MMKLIFGLLLLVGFNESYADVYCRRIVAPPKFDKTCAIQAYKDLKHHYRRLGIEIPHYPNIVQAPYYICTTWIAAYNNCADPVESPDTEHPGYRRTPGSCGGNSRVYCP